MNNSVGKNKVIMCMCLIRELQNILKGKKAKLKDNSTINY